MDVPDETKREQEATKQSSQNTADLLVQSVTVQLLSVPGRSVCAKLQVGVRVAAEAFKVAALLPRQTPKQRLRVSVDALRAMRRQDSGRR
jgi:hypothetical protein